MAFSIFYYKELIKHYGSATLIDVLHSPFIFALYNDCLKKNSNISLNGFVPQSASYMERRAETIVAKFLTRHPDAVIVTHPNQVIPGIPFILTLPIDVDVTKDWEQVLLTAHNDSVVIMHHLYDSPQSAYRWKKLKTLNGITASVDLFFLGFAFVRKEQRRQEFRLRLF